MNKWIVKNITFPLWELGAKRNRLKYLKEMNESQFWPRKKLKRLQDKRLRRLIEHAYTNVPYYTRIFDKLGLKPEDIQNGKDLEKLPILTKDIIADNFEDLKANNFNDFKPEYYQTGGTSGRPLHFYSTPKVFDNHMAALYRGWRWSGWDFGVRYAYIWGSSMDLKDEHTFKMKFKNFFTDNRLTIQAYTFTDKKLDEDCRKIIEYKPDYLVAYPTPLIIIMRHMKMKGLKLKVKGIITSSESLLSWQREQLEDFFCCKVFDDFGSRESSIRATQCKMNKGYHIAVENGIVETIRNGRNIVGKSGKILLTEFHNYAMPLIRYENGDVGILTERQCECGVTLPMFDRIDGRVSDVFKTKDGQYIPAQLFMYAFLDFKGKYYQIVQEKDGNITVKIVKGPHFTEENLSGIKKVIQKWMGNIDVTFMYVKKIPKTKQGKMRYIVSKMDVEW